MDAKERKLVALEVLEIVVSRCIEKHMDDAAEYFGNVLVSLTVKFLKEYPEEAEKFVLRIIELESSNGKVN